MHFNTNTASSTTTTITVSPEPIFPLKLSTPISQPQNNGITSGPENEISKIRSKVNELLEGLKNSSLVTNKELEEIVEWEKEFFQDYFSLLMNNATDDNREVISRVLCYLLENIVGATYFSWPEEQQDLFLVDFQPQVHEILSLILPRSIDPDDFLRAYRNYNEMDKLIDKLIHVAKDHFNGARQLLHQKKDEIQNQISEQYNSSMTCLNQIAIKKKDAGALAVETIQQESNKMANFVGELKQKEVALQAISNRLTKYDSSQKETLNRCEEAINKGI